MNRFQIVPMLAAAALVAGCEAKIGNGHGEDMSNGQASAEGKAEKGEIAFSAPGFDIKMKVPLDKARTDNEGKILYPGAALTGMFIAAHPDAKAGSDGEVELRFASPDPAEEVAAWYQDPARAGDFTLTASGRDGEAYTFTGAEKGESNKFSLRLEPSEGGTDGRLVVRDSD